jgi:hypothetical protein
MPGCFARGTAANLHYRTIGGLVGAQVETPAPTMSMGAVV